MDEPMLTGLLGERVEQSQLQGNINREVSPTLPLGAETAYPAPTGRDAELVQPEELQKRFGDLGLTFDQPMTRAAAEALAEGKRREMIRQSLVSRGPTGVAGVTAQFGTALLRSAMDPIELAALFVPVVSQAKLAGLVARYGAVRGRALAGAIEGTVGNIMLEPAYYGLSKSLQRDYTMTDSLMNVFLGTVLGGVAGAGIGALSRGRAAEAPAPATSRLPEPTETFPINAVEIPGQRPLGLPYYGDTPAQRGDALRGAIGQMVQGQQVSVRPLLNERSAPEFVTEKGSVYRIEPDGTTIRNKAARADPGHESDQGIKPKSARTVYVDQNAAVLSTAGLQNLGPQGARLVVHDGKATLLTWNEKVGKWGTTPSSRDIPIHDEPALGRYPLEVWDRVDDVPGHEAYSNMHAGDRIVEMRGGMAPLPGKPAIPQPPPDTIHVPETIAEVETRAAELKPDTDAPNEELADLAATVRAIEDLDADEVAELESLAKMDAKPIEPTIRAMTQCLRS